MQLFKNTALGCLLIVAEQLACIASGEEGDVKRKIDLGRFTSGIFTWTSSAPLLSPVVREDDPCYSAKDPTVVLHDGKWHLFVTIRSVKRTHQIEYCSFAEWKDADKSPRHVLKLSDGYFCAPQVFYFTPHKKWYMVLQVNDPTRKPALQPAYSTTTDISNPGLWTKPVLLYAEHPKNIVRWIDFWVICDEAKAHLFFTSNDGKMWRAETELADFPGGWDLPRLVLMGGIVEASHTYRLKGLNKYLTLIEAQADGGRYYKAYLSDRLDGEWKPLADTREKPFAGPTNVKFASEPAWSGSVSHGELLRSGINERLEVEPGKLQFLYQGVRASDMRGKPYGQIPWRLGILEPNP